MASFQIHEDQENLANAGRSKSNFARNNAKGLQKRTVLGDINSNSNKINTRSSKSAEPVAEKPLKKCHDFLIHEDVLEPESKPRCRGENSQTSKPKESVLPKPDKKILVESKPKEEGKNELQLDLCKAVISVPRQPLKDLKVCGSVEDEEVMSESYSSPEVASPMSLGSVKISTPPSSPVLRHSKPGLQLLYDMEEYRKDIFQYLLQSEGRAKAKALYMRRQPDVTYSMRSILVDWLVEVAEEYKLHTETLYLAISFIDRFLSVMSVVKGKLQLLGTAAMFVASKYEEIYPPDVGEFVYITDDTYNKRQVLRMEQLILKVLNFDVSVPTIFTFLQHIAVDCNLSVRLTTMAQYLCELTLLEGDPYLVYSPSLIASSALAKARHCLEYEEVWSAELQESTGYSLLQLAPCVAHLNVTHDKASSHPQQAVQEKYKSQKWQRVADVKPLPLIIV